MFLISFLLGIGGSIHCIGMCGPIVIAIPQLNKGNMPLNLNNLLYHLGRIITYGIFGFVIGLFGFGIMLAGIQKYISILLGVSIIIFLLVSRIFGRVIFSRLIPVRYLALLKQWVSQTFNLGKKKNSFTLGMLNGFLPCGLIYVALANSLLTSHPLEGMLFMMVFGLGTIPSLLFLPSIISVFGLKKHNLQRIVPYLLFSLGLFLIFRGINFRDPLFNEINEFISTCIGL